MAVPFIKVRPARHPEIRPLRLNMAVRPHPDMVKLKYRITQPLLSGKSQAWNPSAFWGNSIYYWLGIASPPFTGRITAEQTCCQPIPCPLSIASKVQQQFLSIAEHNLLPLLASVSIPYIDSPCPVWTLVIPDSLHNICELFKKIFHIYV